MLNGENRDEESIARTLYTYVAPAATGLSVNVSDDVIASDAYGVPAEARMISY